MIIRCYCCWQDENGAADTDGQVRQANLLNVCYQLSLGHRFCIPATFSKANLRSIAQRVWILFHNLTTDCIYFLSVHNFPLIWFAFIIFILLRIFQFMNYIFHHLLLTADFSYCMLKLYRNLRFLAHLPSFFKQKRNLLNHQSILHPMKLLNQPINFN
jgi:hypothetical protein